MKNKLSLIYKILILIVTGIGLFLNFKFLTFKTAIAYFTIQSNLLCFIFYLICLILYIFKKLKKNEFYYIMKGMATMAITLTMVVYYGVINTHGVTGYEGHLIECLFVHLFTPLLVIFDYIIFDEKGNLKLSYPFIWSSLLIIYVLFSELYSKLGNIYVNGKKYAYFFLDTVKYGESGVIINLLLILVSFIVFGLVVSCIDERLKK